MEPRGQIEATIDQKSKLAYILIFLSMSCYKEEVVNNSTVLGQMATCGGASLAASIGISGSPSVSVNLYIYEAGGDKIKNAS